MSSLINNGLRLPPKKQLATLPPRIIAPVPEQLIISLQQSVGPESIPVVSIGEKVLTGQLIAVPPDTMLGSYMHASGTGTVSAISKHKIAGRNNPVTCVSIDTATKEQIHPDCVPLTKIQTLSPVQLRKIIEEAGIVGLGGALFPASVKLNPAAGIQTLLINGAECEPYINCDNQLMQENAAELIEGAKIMAQVAGATDIVFACKAEMIDARNALLQALSDSPDPRVSIRQVPDLYPAGGERQLITSITGREVPAGGLPADIGVVCQNVGTAKAVYDRIMTGLPLISRVVTLTGSALAGSINVEARIGTPANELIESTVGIPAGDNLIISGGPMMGFALPANTTPVTKATNCLIVATPGELSPPSEEQPCIRCGDCIPACPAGLSPMLLLDTAKRNDAAALESAGVLECIECGCCDYVCPSAIPLTAGFRTGKSQVWEQHLLSLRAERSQQRFEAHEVRTETRRQDEQQQLQSQTHDFSPQDGKQALDDLMQRLQKDDLNKDDLNKNKQNRDEKGQGGKSNEGAGKPGPDRETLD